MIAAFPPRVGDLARMEILFSFSQRAAPNDTLVLRSVSTRTTQMLATMVTGGKYAPVLMRCVPLDPSADTGPWCNSTRTGPVGITDIQVIEQHEEERGSYVFSVSGISMRMVDGARDHEGNPSPMIEAREMMQVQTTAAGPTIAQNRLVVYKLQVWALVSAQSCQLEF